MNQPLAIVILSYVLVGASLAGCLVALYKRLRQYHKSILKNTLISTKTIVSILSAVLISRLFLLGIAFLVRYFVPVLHDCPLEHILVRWDANHYLKIAQEGYSASQVDHHHLLIVFYPLYPWLIRLFTLAGLKTSDVSMGLSTLMLAGAAIVIYIMTDRQYDKAHARRAVKFLLIFPASVFLGLPFTESLFILLSSLCLLFLMDKRWLVAGICGGLAALTRNVGVILVIPFFIEVLMAHDLIEKGAFRNVKAKFTKVILPMLCLLIIFIGAGIYLLVNATIFGNPLAFLGIQKSHWQQGLSLPFYAFGNTIMGAFTFNIESTRYFLWMPQLILIILAYSALPWAIKRLRLSWAIYLLAYTLIAFSASWLLSGVRYMMGLMVIYPLLASFTKKKWINILVTIISIIWACFMAVGYFLGYAVM